MIRINLVNPHWLATVKIIEEKKKRASKIVVDYQYGLLGWLGIVDARTCRIHLPFEIATASDVRYSRENPGNADAVDSLFEILRVEGVEKLSELERHSFTIEKGRCFAWKTILEEIQIFASRKYGEAEMFKKLHSFRRRR